MLWLQKFREYAPPTGQWLLRTGIVLMVLAAIFAAHSWRSTRGLLRATATVTENVATFAPGGGVAYTPRLRFTLPNTSIVLTLAAAGSKDIDFPAGETVPVMYAPGHPENALIATVWRLYSRATILGVLGILILDLGLILQRISL